VSEASGLLRSSLTRLKSKSSKSSIHKTINDTLDSENRSRLWAVVFVWMNEGECGLKQWQIMQIWHKYEQSFC